MCSGRIERGPYLNGPFGSNRLWSSNLLANVGQCRLTTRPNASMKSLCPLATSQVQGWGEGRIHFWGILRLSQPLIKIDGSPVSPFLEVGVEARAL